MAIGAIEPDKMRIVLDQLAVKIYLASVRCGDDCVAKLARFQTMPAKYFFDKQLAHKKNFSHSISRSDET
jgi:hypothetical protein